MKLHTVFITYNRLELTKRAVESYFDTVTAPHSFVIVDNGSTDGTEEWLFENFRYAHYLLKENKYPGFAANFGWQDIWRLHTGATHLHRADNDFIFLPGWCEEVERMFSLPKRRALGQLGMRTDEEEEFNSHNVGGNCLIAIELWEKGLRYDETPWPEIQARGWTEDSYMSPKVLRMGYRWDRVESCCIRSISTEDPNDPYYIKTWTDRGIVKDKA